MKDPYDQAIQAERAHKRRILGPGETTSIHVGSVTFSDMETYPPDDSDGLSTYQGEMAGDGNVLRALTSVLMFLGFLGCIPLANWLIGNVGIPTENGPHIIPVGWGLYAPSGVLAIGPALVLRDMVHERFGLMGAVLAVVLGAMLSLAFGPWQIAVAAAVTFLVAELADTMVYAPLRSYSRPLAVVCSQVVGSIIDSLLFVRLAFGSFDYAWPQAVAKVEAGLIVAVLLWAYLWFKGRPLGNS